MKTERPTPTDGGELTTEIHINTAEIPDYIRDNLAAVTLRCFKSFIAVPGNTEWLDERIAARRAAAAVK